MRVFFALQPDPDILVRLADWRDRQFTGTGRPVPPANLHVTLAFVGDVRAGSLDELCDSVDRWCEKATPRGGELVLDQTGYWHRPGIYWIGPTRWPDSLAHLAAGLQSIAARAGGKRKSGDFLPHITLFRGCQGAPPAPAAMPGVALSYSGFSLFESCQGRQGVTYQPIQDWELAPDT